MKFFEHPEGLTTRLVQGGWTPLLSFILLRRSENNLHLLDSPEPALQDDTIFVGN